MLLGAVVGGALVYFLDPQNGAARRQRLADWWEQNREPVINSATSAASTVQARATETTSKVNEKVTELGAKVRGDSSSVSVK